MNATEKLHELGQSLWLDNITRELLDSGQLQTYIDDYSVTGLTSNPSIFDKAIASGGYDDAIQRPGRGRRGPRGDLLRARDRGPAPRRRPVRARSTSGRTGVDGWVSLEVSPLLAYDTASTVEAAKSLHARGRPRQPLHQDPGNGRGPARDRGGDRGGRAGERDAPLLARALPRRRRGVHARGRAADRGGPRARSSARSPPCSCRAGTPPSSDKVPDELRDTLALAIGLKTYAAYRELLDSDRWQRLENAGRAAAAAALGEHEHEGPAGARRPLPPLPRGAVHGQHDSRGDAAGVLRPRPRRHADADGRRRRRRDPRGARGRRNRRRRARREAPVRRARRASSRPGTT